MNKNNVNNKCDQRIKHLGINEGHIEDKMLIWSLNRTTFYASMRMQLLLLNILWYMVGEQVKQIGPKQNQEKLFIVLIPPLQTVKNLCWRVDSLQKQQEDLNKPTLTITKIMNLQSTFEEEQLTTYRHIQQDTLLFQSGDILLGKCINEEPWPCLISHFIGYDEDSIQVYHVKFLASIDQANLETNNLLPITRMKLNTMKKRRGKYKQFPNFLMAIKQAQQKIYSKKEMIGDDDKKMLRFIKLYCSNQKDQIQFIETKQLKQNFPYLNMPKRSKRGRRLQKIHQISIKIEVYAEIGQESMLLDRKVTVMVEGAQLSRTVVGMRQDYLLGTFHVEVNVNKNNSQQQ